MKGSSVGSHFFRLVGWLACLALLAQPGLGARAARRSAVIPVVTTIQAAINSAQSGDTISIPARIDPYNESLTINGKNLTLMGASKDTVVIQAVSNQRVITVQSGYNLTLIDVTLRNGVATSPGYNEGGGVWLWNGILTIDHCNLTSN